MSDTNNKSGEKGTDKPATSAYKSGMEQSIWAPKEGEKTTIGDRPYEFKQPARRHFHSGIDESMWAPANLPPPSASQTASRAVPIVAPEARNEAAFLAEYNLLVQKYAFTAPEGAAIIYKAVYGDVERLSEK